MTIGQQEKDISVCVRLKAERELMGLTQQEVADALEVSLKTVTRWEKLIPIPSDKLSSLASLGFDLLYVLTGERSEHKIRESGGAAYAKLSPEKQTYTLGYGEESVIMCMRKLTGPNQDILRGIARSILETQELRAGMDELSKPTAAERCDDWWPEKD